MTAPEACSVPPEVCPPPSAGSNTTMRTNSIKVVVALDETEASWDAAVFAGELLPAEAEVTVVNVVSSLDPVAVPASGLVGLPTGGIVPGPDRDDVLARLRPASAAAAADDVVLEEGGVVDRVTAVAQARNADLVVVGARERSGLLSRLSPSVSRRLLDEVDCPVLIVQ